MNIEILLHNPILHKKKRPSCGLCVDMIRQPSPNSGPETRETHSQRERTDLWSPIGREWWGVNWGLRLVDTNYYM